jgi:hypothetical protein
VSNINIIAQLHGASMPAFSGYEKPALGGRVWQQQPNARLITDATGPVPTSTTDNSTRVSEVDRHT